MKYLKAVVNAQARVLIWIKFPEETRTESQELVINGVGFVVFQQTSRSVEDLTRIHIMEEIG